MCVATSTAIGIGSAVGSGAAGIWAANKNSDAAENAAKLQTQAANQAAELQKEASDHAAQLQSDAAANTLAFTKQQAGLTRADSITAQKASYDQWLYRQGIARPYQSAGLGANNTLAQMLGLPPQIVGLPDTPAAPRFSGESGGPGGSSGGPPPTIDPTKDISPQLDAYFKSRGKDSSEVPYWAQKWNEFGKNDPEYFGRRLADADIFNS